MSTTTTNRARQWWSSLTQARRDELAVRVRSRAELRNMTESTFVEEWTKPEARRRYSYNDLLAEAMRRGYNAEGKQVAPARAEQGEESKR